MRHLLPVTVLVTALLRALPAAAVAPVDAAAHPEQLGTLRPPPSAALPPAAAGRWLSLPMDEDGSVAFLGRLALPPPAAGGSSLVPDPAQPVRAYFQGLVGDPQLELQLVSQVDEGDETRMAFVQARHGVPILGTFALAQLQDGMLHYARHLLVRAPALNTAPRLGAAAAAQAALRDARSFAAAAEAAPQAPQLAILYASNAPTLVWTVVVTTEQPFGSWELFIDARGGALVGRHKTSHDGVDGEVVAAVEPQCQGEAPRPLPLPFVQWAHGLATGAAGDFSSAAAAPSSQVRLSGPHFQIRDYGRHNYAFAAHLEPAPAFNEVQLEGAPLSQVDPFYYASQARGWLRYRLAEMPEFAAARAWQWSRTQVPVNVNLPGGYRQFGGCNAFYDPARRSLNFFVATPGQCNNSGRAARIVQHEYGHSVHDHLTWSRQTFDPQVSEGVADYVAATINDSPHITGLTGCHTILRTCDNHATYCRGPHCTATPGDPRFGRSEAHNAAPPICGALWDLRRQLGAAATDHFFLKFLALVSNMNSSYQEAIAADEDDDRDPSNGTVHSCEINRAFLGLGGGFAHFPDLVRQAVPCVPRAAAAAAAPAAAALPDWAAQP